MLSAVAALLLTLPASAGAKTNIRVGIGDQNVSMFDQELFQDLNIKRTRYFIRWDAAKDPYYLQQADVFVDHAKQNGVSVLMHISSNNLTRKKAKLPSVKTYKKEVGKLVKRYRAQGVKEWGTWNEANHDSQPTYKSPSTAAKYFVELYRMCKGCTIVGLDVLDQAGVERYIQRFYKALSPTYRKRARIVGIHNYSDVNRKRTKGTSSIIRTVRAKGRNTSAKFWFTETGAQVSFGRSFPCSEKRAANRTKYMFTLAKKYKKVVQRLYQYAYWGNDCEERFDAGLVNADGTARPGYDAFKSGIKGFLR